MQPEVRLVSAPGPKTGRRYTTAEDETIRRLYPTTAALAIARQFGRTQAGIRHRANVLGVRCSEARRVEYGNRFNGPIK